MLIRTPDLGVDDHLPGLPLFHQVVMDLLNLKSIVNARDEVDISESIARWTSSPMIDSQLLIEFGERQGEKP